MTVQAAFTSMVKDNLAPRLRAMGMKGSGQKYSVKDSDFFASVGLQKSAYSTSDYIKFTMNITVVMKSAWEKYLEINPWSSKQPSGNAAYGYPTYFERIGTIMGTGDYWWEFTKQTEPDGFADAIAEVVQRFALPEMHVQMETQRRSLLVTDMTCELDSWSPPEGFPDVTLETRDDASITEFVAREHPRFSKFYGDPKAGATSYAVVSGAAIIACCEESKRREYKRIRAQWVASIPLYERLGFRKSVVRWEPQ